MERKKMKGGSHNPIVFNDYESFIKKFTENPKTTDECWTPQDVWEAVRDYVGTIYPLEGKQVLRPFYPGGDYEHAEYPADGVVIDNPPFSMFTRICKFYVEHGIPFFLFGPGMTIFSCLKYGASAVIIGDNLTFTNGAKVRCNFATNLLGDVLAVASPRLSSMIAKCASQDTKVGLPSYDYPPEVLSVSDLQTIAKGTEEFSVLRSEAVISNKIDLHPSKSGHFGEFLFISKAKAKAKAKAVISIHLSEREEEIVAKLSQ